MAHNYAKQSKHKFMLDITWLNILSFIYSGFIYKINKKCYMMGRIFFKYFGNTCITKDHNVLKTVMYWGTCSTSYIFTGKTV